MGVAYGCGWRGGSEADAAKQLERVPTAEVCDEYWQKWQCGPASRRAPRHFTKEEREALELAEMTMENSVRVSEPESKKLERLRADFVDVMARRYANQDYSATDRLITETEIAARALLSVLAEEAPPAKEAWKAESSDAAATKELEAREYEARIRITRAIAALSAHSTNLCAAVCINAKRILEGGVEGTEATK